MLCPIDNPPNPYLSQHAEWLEPPPPARVEVYEERSGSVLTENDSPDLPFRWTVNPYRGCQHACAYCYARPYHEYLGLGAGTDFDTKIIVKTNAPQRLDAALLKKSWKRELVVFSGITDCYQPLEAAYGLTRQCLEVCLARQTPASVITKSYLVIRDIDLLGELQKRHGGSVHLSIPFADDGMSRLIEPHAPTGSRRFEAARRMADAGLRVTVMIAPLIPGLNDREVPELVRRAAESGAKAVRLLPLRLAGNVRPVFLSRLKAALPLRAARVEARLREIRGGRITESRFGERFRGSGTYWESIRRLFEISRQKFGMDGDAASTSVHECGDAARTPQGMVQLPLFPA